MQRILALDIGEKRIGVAVSDALNITAQGLETIKRLDKESTFFRIKALAEEYDVSRIIAGMPLNMNGTKGRAGELVEEFLAGLGEKIEVPIDTIDERLTSVQGERLLLEADISRKKRRRSIDKVAAQLILQNYLDSHVQKDKT